MSLRLKIGREEGCGGQEGLPETGSRAAETGAVRWMDEKDVRERAGDGEGPARIDFKLASGLVCV